jgi:protein SCO1/2
MRPLRPAWLVFALMSEFAAPALAHSLKDLDQELFTKEKYFQPVDIKAPDFALLDADGKRVGLADFHGRVVVLSFIYTNCPDVCPLHSEKIAALQSLINTTPMKAMVEFVSITTDDKGQVLRDYGKAHGLDPVNWAFLTAPPDAPDDATRKIAEAYGLTFTKGEGGAQMHAIVTHVIDQDGRMWARFHGLKFDPVNFVLFVNALTNNLQKHHHEEAPSLWDRLKGFL